MSTLETYLKVFVSKLPKEWTETRVREFFEIHASITSVSLFRDNGESEIKLDLGCAYITFTRKSEAEDVIRKFTRQSVCNYIF